MIEWFLVLSVNIRVYETVQRPIAYHEFKIPTTQILRILY